MGGCSGICRDPGPGPANPRDWDRDPEPRDSRDRDKHLRDSRDRDKHLRDSPAAKIPRDNKSRHFGTRIPISSGTVPLSRDSTGHKSRLVPQSNLLFLSRIVFGPSSSQMLRFFYSYVIKLIYVGTCGTVPRDASPDLSRHFFCPVGKYRENFFRSRSFRWLLSHGRQKVSGQSRKSRHILFE